MSTIYRFVIVAVVCATTTCFAEEFRVFTKVYDLGNSAAAGGENAKPEVVSSSLSLFHGGKVYDYVDGEVIILEQDRRRFTILNTTRELVTSVEFAEVEAKLETAEQELAKYISQFSGGSARERRLQQVLQFQLNPTFETQFDPKASRLTFAHDFYHYAIRTGEAMSSAPVDRYLNAIDWTHRLNYVLRPRTVFPAPRLVVNQRLKRDQRLPIDVELKIDLDQPLHLRAEHKFRWDLGDRDLSLIRTWESQLRGDRVTRVTFREYQRALFAKAASAK